jgi:hypothetical protein
MRNIDKSVFRVISTQEDLDYDAVDISIALKCDDEEVREALDSLSDQGLIEAVIHNGRKFWKTARPYSFLNADEPYIAPRPIQDESVVDLLIFDQPVRQVTSSEQRDNFHRAPDQSRRPLRLVEQTVTQERFHERRSHAPISTARPEKWSYENTIANEPTKIITPAILPPRPKAASVADDFDDDEFDFDKPRFAGSSAVLIACAVLLSVGISAVITMSLTNNASKRLIDVVSTLEGKMTKSDVQLNGRIDALSLKIDDIKSDIAARPVVSAPAQGAKVKALRVKSVWKKAMKPAVRARAAKKTSMRRATPPDRKRRTASDIIRETSESAAPSASIERTKPMESSPSATETPSSSTTESGSSPSSAEPSASSSSSEGVGESTPYSSSSTDGSGQ